MKKLLFILSIITLTIGLYGQKYNTDLMHYQSYSNGVPGPESISIRNDTIVITSKSISITNYVYGSKKTSTFKITSVANNVYTCQVDEFTSYKVYVKEGWIIVEKYLGKDLFTLRKYLIKPAGMK